jgi:hypothetical protein
MTATIDKTAMRTRVQLVVDTINKCHGNRISPIEVYTAMATDQGLIDFARRYGQRIDWLVLGDLGGMIMTRVEAAGWRRKVAS